MFARWTTVVIIVEFDWLVNYCVTFWCDNRGKDIVDFVKVYFTISQFVGKWGDSNREAFW